MARLFDGTDDEIQCSMGACNITFGTMAAILRRGSSTSEDTVIMTHTAGGVRSMGMFIAATDELFYQSNTISTETPTLTVLATDGWVLIATGKATGTATPRAHKYRYDTNAWTHENHFDGIANSTAPGSDGTVRFGEMAASSFFIGDMLLLGLWNYKLSDAEVETLPFTLQAWLTTQTPPVGLWLLDQSATTQNVIDITGGGANQSLLTGTAVATNHPPVFNRYGGILLAQRPQVAVTSAASYYYRTQKLRRHR